MPDTILIVDSDPMQLRLQEQALQRLSYRTIVLNSMQTAVDWLASGKQPRPNIMLIDLGPEGAQRDGILKQIQSLKADMPAVAFIPYGDDSCAGRAMESGIYDFLHKPVTMEKLKICLRNAIGMQRTRHYLEWLERKIAGHVDFSDMVGDSLAFKEAVALAQQAAASKIPLWIEGENGTGKEMLARAIHGSSDRAGKPFVIVHCELLPEHLAEAILFGQEKEGQGQFSLGKLREADHGTLMIEEIDTLAPALQQKLLAFLDSGKILPLGGKEPVAVDARIICTTCKPAQHFAKLGDAGLKLCRRLQSITIGMPPLSRRVDDVVPLALHFLAMYTASEHKYVQRISEQAQWWLTECLWPGNVRQLANTIWRAVVLCDKNEIDTADLQAVQRAKPIHLPDYMQGVAPLQAALMDDKGKIKTLKSVQEEAIYFALQQAGGCMTRAARNLGIGRSTLYRKVGELERHGQRIVRGENKAG